MAPRRFCAACDVAFDTQADADSHDCWQYRLAQSVTVWRSTSPRANQPRPATGIDHGLCATPGCGRPAYTRYEQDAEWLCRTCYHRRYRAHHPGAA